MKKIVINKCYGGFGLSDEGYEKLIEWGIPVRKYIEEVKDEEGRYHLTPDNEGEVIFDRELTAYGESEWNDKFYHNYKDEKTFLFHRYWDNGWTNSVRDHPLLVRLVEELGERANGSCSELSVVEIPDDVKWVIQEYDGNEWIAEQHRTWS